uniref:Solute carrier family 30 member 2 n=1 Tax=Astyanax mexicanus TaxID=7994 RepID=A0A8B9GX83_ASTMX
SERYPKQHSSPPRISSRTAVSDLSTTTHTNTVPSQCHCSAEDDSPTTQIKPALWWSCGVLTIKEQKVLGGLLSVLSIWAVTAVLVFIAIQRILQNDYEIHSGAMLITSGCAVIVNILMALILHQSPAHHGHSHGHSNTSVRAAFIHVVGDLLQSLGVALAATIIYFWPEWKIADPVCTFLFSILILATTSTILKDIFKVLMEGTPHGIDFDFVKEALLSVRGVKSIHSLHLWALTMSQPQISVHTVIDEQTSPQTVLLDLTEMLQSDFNFHNITIQIETYSNDAAHCRECQDPID